MTSIQDAPLAKGVARQASELINAVDGPSEESPDTNPLLGILAAPPKNCRLTLEPLLFVTTNVAIIGLPSMTVRVEVSRVIVSPVEEVEVRMSALLIAGSIRKQSRVNRKT